MAEVLPKARPTDLPKKTVTNLLDQKENGSSTTIDGTATNKKLAGKLRGPTSPAAQVSESNHGNHDEEGRTSSSAIDPLSQQILQRTNTSPAVQRIRPLNLEGQSQAPASPSEAQTYRTPNREINTDVSGSAKTDKNRKGVSFLSRFIGSNKKKGTNDGASDAGSEVGDLRREGTNAQLYVNNLSFSPKFLHPPAYIKVRARFKKEKEFDRVFLAQELQSGCDKHAPPVVGSNPAPQSGSAATQNPTWALEFSKDGKYLAAGGQDRVVRVWAVIASPEERRSHERDEHDPHVSEGDGSRLSAPVFQQKCVRKYEGHTATILDLSWSKNNFLLSSSMDKTVRLWHVSRNETLCTFKHSDFVPSVQFHPTDDRFFLAGSLDAKLRLWSIPDKSVAYISTIPDMITAVNFTPDGKTCIAGTLGGLCLFYETEGLKWQSQVHVKSTRGQNAKGSKITGIQTMYWPPGSEGGEIKLLVSSNDSRLRLYNFKDKSLEMKFKGHENNCSQIRAAFADSTGHIICGSEDRKAYIWSTTSLESEKKDQRPVELFEAHNSITTCTVIAPVQTRRLLSASEDPIYDLCNPPPVTLVSRAESIKSSRAPTETEFLNPIATPTNASFSKATERPGYAAKSAHIDGNIIITADYTGAIKVFRQDCAFEKRMRKGDVWDSSSPKRQSGFGRPSSVISRASRSRRSSISTQPPNDRIMTWRQGIGQGSFDSTNSSLPRRSASPRKSLASLNLRQPNSPALAPISAPDLTSTRTSSITPDPSISPDRTTSLQSAPSQSSKFASSPPSQQNPPEPNDTPNPSTPPREQRLDPNPLTVFNGQSWLFWTKAATTMTQRRSATPSTPTISIPPSSPEPQRPDMENHHRYSQISQLSKLTDELSDRRLSSEIENE